MTAKADTNPLREALADIKSWRDDTLGKRPKERGEYDCAPEITEAFDRGARMAFYRCADRATAALASEPVAGTAFQRRVQDWMMECFSMEICRDTMERNHRFLEESLELVQSLGCTASEAHQLVDYVYGRPVGERNQEVGGVKVTLAALCIAADLDMDAAGETELARVWTKIDKIRAKQAAKPKHSPLPEGPAVPPQGDRTTASTPRPVAWGRVIDGKAITISRDWTPANDEPLYATPPAPGAADRAEQAAVDFCAWLRGYFAGSLGKDELSAFEANTIRNTLNMVPLSAPANTGETGR